MIEGKITLHRCWRSQWKRMIVFFVLAAASIFLSSYFPESILRGHLITIAGATIFLNLPLFTFLPLYGLVNLVLPIYDVKFTIDNRGLESRIGILSLNQKIVRVRYEDIRSLELTQTLIERAIKVGAISIGSAATSGIELTFDGLSTPHEIKTLVQQERDKRARKGPIQSQKIQAAL